MADYETIIVGAGRAGISLALRLIAAGRDDLCILEQGQVSPDVAAEVAEHDLGSFMRVGARAATAAWDARRQHWVVAIAGAQSLTARAVVGAWGRDAALPEIAGSGAAAFDPGDAVAVPGFPGLFVLSGAAEAGRAEFVLAAVALLDEPGAVEASAPLTADFDAGRFTRIPEPEVKSIYC